VGQERQGLTISPNWPETHNLLALAY
jgi:hypothetical protein